MHTPDQSWQFAATGAINGVQCPRQAWWQKALNALRPPVWAAIVATLIALALLLAFTQVVAQAVTRGDLRRMATASQVESVWRCKLLRTAGERGSCLVQVGLAQEPSPVFPRLAKSTQQ